MGTTEKKMIGAIIFGWMLLLGILAGCSGPREGYAPGESKRIEHRYQQAKAREAQERQETSDKEPVLISNQQPKSSLPDDSNDIHTAIESRLREMVELESSEWFMNGKTNDIQELRSILSAKCGELKDMLEASKRALVDADDAEEAAKSAREKSDQLLKRLDAIIKAGEK